MPIAVKIVIANNSFLTELSRKLKIGILVPIIPLKTMPQKYQYGIIAIIAAGPLFAIVATAVGSAIPNVQPKNCFSLTFCLIALIFVLPDILLISNLFPCILKTLYIIF